ncbi:hypothetical protein V2J09_002564 [Rumex salicifolius]
MGKSAVVIFDFDRTIIDGDSDNWVVTHMGLTPLFNQLVSKLPWNSLMNKMMEELHSQGKTTEDIAQCLNQTPLEPQIVSAIKAAHAAGCELRIVSDANQFFIETILKHHGLLSCFTEIITNPSLIDEQGKLRIFPFHDSRSSPHGCSCKFCPPNMCKGLILEQMQASIGKGCNSTFIYLGDGGGDYCPSLKLGNGDHVMPRKNYPLSECIKSNPKLVQAQVHEWSNAEEFYNTLVYLISKVLTVDKYEFEKSHLGSADSDLVSLPTRKSNDVIRPLGDEGSVIHRLSGDILVLRRLLLTTDEPRRISHRRRSWRSNLRPLSNPHVSQDRRAGADKHAVADLGMSIAAGLSSTAEGDMVKNRAVVADNSSLADNDSGSVVKEDAAAECGGGVDVDGEYVGYAGVESERERTALVGPEEVGDAVCLTGEKSLVVEKTVGKRCARRVPETGGAEIGDGGGNQCGIREEGVEKESLLPRWNASDLSSDACERIVEYRYDASAGSDSASRLASALISAHTQASSPAEEDSDGACGWEIGWIWSPGMAKLNLGKFGI